jgi:hypothetical protein
MWALLATSSEESLYSAYESAIRLTPPAYRGATLAATERALYEMRDRRARQRVLLRVLSLGVALFAAAGFVLNEIEATRTDKTCYTTDSTTCVSTPTLSTDAVWAGRIAYGSLFALGVTSAVASYVPYPSERLADIWASDPGRVRESAAVSPVPRVSLAPMPGGGRLELGWRF